MTDSHAGDVGDRVVRGRDTVADRDAEVSGSHHLSKLDSMAKTEAKRELWGPEIADQAGQAQTQADNAVHRVDSLQNTVANLDNYKLVSETSCAFRLRPG